MELIKFDTDEVREQLMELDRAKQQVEQQEESTVEPIKEKNMQNLKTKSEVNDWLDMQSGNELEIIKNISSLCGINLSDAMSYIHSYPSSPIVGEKKLPDLVKEMRRIRRGLKGEQRNSIAKGIDHLITAYQEYIGKCVKSIYWLRPYTSPLYDINLSESKIKLVSSSFFNSVYCSHSNFSCISVTDIFTS